MSNHPKPIFIVGMPGNGVEVVSEIISQHSDVDTLTGLSKFSSEHDQHFKRMTESAGRSQHQLFTESYGLVASKLFPAERFDFDGSNDGFTDWLAKTQYPVVHIVRDNMLNCLAHRMAKNDVKEIESDRAISFVEQLAEIQTQIRMQLNAGNCLEVTVEQLLRRNEEVSTFAIQQICNFARIDASTLEMSVTATVDSELIRLECNRIKRELRPEMTRRGWSNLFELPKAA